MRPSDLCSKGLSVLDFLVVCIHHAVVRRAGVGACRAALGAALLLVQLLGYGIERLLRLFCGSLNGLHIAALVGLLQILNGGQIGRASCRERV